MDGALCGAVVQNLAQGCLCDSPLVTLSSSKAVLSQKGKQFFFLVNPKALTRKTLQPKVPWEECLYFNTTSHHKHIKLLNISSRVVSLFTIDKVFSL